MKQLANLVHKQLKPLYRKRGGAVADVLFHWRQILPDFVNEATPTKLNRGVLTIATSSAAVAQQLQLMQMQILANCGMVLGADMVVRLKFENAYFTPARAPEKPQHVENKQGAQVVDASPVTREDLRASLRNLERVVKPARTPK